METVIYARFSKGNLAVSRRDKSLAKSKWCSANKSINVFKVNPQITRENGLRWYDSHRWVATHIHANAREKKMMQHRNYQPRKTSSNKQTKTCINNYHDSDNEHFSNSELRWLTQSNSSLLESQKFTTRTTNFKFQLKKTKKTVILLHTTDHNGTTDSSTVGVFQPLLRRRVSNSPWNSQIGHWIT